jgi:hypothetical protein
MQAPFKWDYNSDQPYQLKDRAYKKKMRKKVRFSIFKTVMISLIVLPLSILARPFLRKKDIDSQTFFGMGIDPKRHPQESLQMIRELGVESVLIRVGLWEIQKLDLYREFCSNLTDKKIMINIMQDREHIEDLELLKRDLFKIFTTLSEYADTFLIGTTINRAKWGFFGVDEYLRFYKCAYDLRDTEFKTLKLVGPGVIDFEFHFTAHALFNLQDIYFDALSSLLYVDRRGAPENRQMGFSLFDKIKLQSAMMMLSPKVGKKFYITETNWPISDTAPFAPTSEHECVSEEDYAVFMLRYYLLAFASREVDIIYWHQLIASGYGLVDERESLRKRLAYDVFKSMLKQLKGSSFISYRVVDKRHTLTCKNSSQEEFSVIWLESGRYTLNFDRAHTVISFDGKSKSSLEAILSIKPLYIYSRGDL